MRVGTAMGPLALLLCLVGSMEAQRPKVGIGVGGGVLLGTHLLDHGFPASLDGRDFRVIQQIDIEDLPVVSAHGEWYITRHIALRGHVARGVGRLRINEVGEDDGDLEFFSVNDASSDVEISTYDAGLSIWPWGPRTIGFAPFLTLGIGTLVYDFDSIESSGIFRASGRRSGRTFMVGIGADMNVWRALTLRMEAVNHRTDSPLEPEDFALAMDPAIADQLDESISNVRLVLGVHIYLPFTSLNPTE